MGEVYAATDTRIGAGGMGEIHTATDTRGDGLKVGGMRLNVWRFEMNGRVPLLVCVVAGAVLSAACNRSPSSGAVGRGNYALMMNDGSFRLFAGGPDTIALIQAGTVPDENSAFTYYELHVPGQLVTTLVSTKVGVSTLSLESPDPNIELTAHLAATDQSPLRHIVAHPGDPWITGLAQVYFSPDQVDAVTPTPAGLFDLIVYTPVRNANGGLFTPPRVSRLEIKNGMVPDPAGIPMLNYSNPNPRTWPELPGSWQ